MLFNSDNEQITIQTLLRESFGGNINEPLIKLLQCGYHITYEDRKALRDTYSRDDYKYYATLSRLSYNLYQQGFQYLIPMMLPQSKIMNTIYTIEAVITNKPDYFGFKTNVWLCIANNAIRYYFEYWVFCEAALKQYGKWDEVFKADSFRTKYDELDKNAILLWKNSAEYELFSLLYPQLKVPTVQFIKKEIEPTLILQEESPIRKSELSDMLEALGKAIEKQQTVWGLHEIPGKTPEEKIYSLWNNYSHEDFLEAVFALAGYKYSYIILNLLREYAENEIINALYDSEVNYILRIGLESGKVHYEDFLFLLWELGYRYYTLEEWQKSDNLISKEMVRLYCIDKLYYKNLRVDLKNVISTYAIRAICLIEDIKNNRLRFTGQPTWKSHINNIQSNQYNQLNEYWGYIDIALDGFCMANGQSMRSYLLKKEPGIKLQKSEKIVNTDSDFYKALAVLYPEVYK